MRRLSLPSASPNACCKNSEYDIKTEVAEVWVWLCSPDGDEVLLLGGSGEGGHCLRRGRGGREAKEARIRMPIAPRGRIGVWSVPGDENRSSTVTIAKQGR